MVRDLLARHGVRADKGFGQHFLVDPAALADIVAAAGLTDRSVVLEVGPGLGTLTVQLAQRAARVIAIELDAGMLRVLGETLLPHPNVELVAGDALGFDLAALPRDSLLVANLPYNVATAVVAKALEAGRFTRLVVLVQREVAQRLVARAGDAAYGALSLLVERRTTVRRIVRHVTPGSFDPPPRVTSSVVLLDVDPDAGDAPGLDRLVRQSFAHRRKTLKRNLLYAGHPEARVDAALAAMGLDQRVRAEALALAQFEALSVSLGCAR